MVNITLPLCRGRVITLPNGEKTWINFKYERLPSLCYWCGRVNHDDKDCKLWLESNGTLITEQQQFGSFLRAPPFKMAGKDVIYIPGYFKKTNRRSQWEKLREEEVQDTGGGCSDLVEPTTEVVMECESDQPNREVVTVMEINDQSNTFKERITDESRIDTRNGKETASHNLGSNDGALKSAVKVIDCGNYADSSLLEKENSATEKEVNIGVLNFAPIINAHISLNKEVEENPNSLEATLAAPAHENHVTLNVEKLSPTQSTVEAEENPKNIRSWKRIMCQPNPNETEAICIAGKKRKASTCMVTTHESSHKRL